jgi:predicted glycosyltransferase involved in capsule biosynthesis
MSVKKLNISLFRHEVCFYETSHSEKKFSVIIPYRYCEGREDAFNRISNIVKNIHAEVDVQILVVDSGSPKVKSNELRKYCLLNNVSYAYVDTRKEMFSAGKARDIGVVLSGSEYVFYQDIDLLSYPGFYSDLLEEAGSLSSDPARVSVYPCFYLNREESQLFLEADRKGIREEYFNKYLLKDRALDNVAVWSSANLINRRHLLGIGGHDPEFFGHGFEDFELFNRLAFFDNRYVRPNDYYVDYRNWSPVEYKGFRSYFRNYGAENLSKQKFMVHIFHETVNFKQSYVSKNKDNKSLLSKKMRDFDLFHRNPQALPDIRKGVSAYVGKQGGAFERSVNYAFPDFGIIKYVSEEDFIDGEEFFKYITKIGCERVIMSNPYGNESRLAIYKSLKDKLFPVVVSDRGALSNSFFFDSGFNFDSDTYKPQLWDEPLSEDETNFVESYIEEEVLSDISLEEQPGRKSDSEILKFLDISTDKKILFVPFQRPKDTVVKYFASKTSGINGFVDEINAIASKIGKEWVVVCKVHPLEEEILINESDNVRVIANDAHFKDLLRISDAVALINSGVGVYALMFGKPVFVFGSAFYNHPGLCQDVRGADELLDKLEKCTKPDEEKVFRFIHHLVNRVYSFGRIYSEKKKDFSGNNHRVTRYVDFSSVRINSLVVCEKEVRDTPVYPMKSPVYDRYRFWIDNVKNTVTKSKNANKSEAAMQPKSSNRSDKNAKADQAERAIKKRLKLKRDPYLYFYDAKNPASRYIRFFFKDNAFGRINKIIVNKVF